MTFLSHHKMRLQKVIIASIIVILLSFLFFPLFQVKASGASFQTQLLTSNCMFEFQKAVMLDQHNPSHPTFALENGLNVWYGIDVTGSPGVKLQSATSLNSNPVNWIMTQEHLLPPVGAFPNTFDPLSFSRTGYQYATVQATTQFKGLNQSLTMSLSLYEPLPVTLDILGMFTELLGESQSGNALGLLKLNNLQQIQQNIYSFSDLTDATQAYVQLLKEVTANPDQFTSDVQDFVGKVLKLASDAGDQVRLAQLLQLYLGIIPSDAIVQSLQGLGTGLSASSLTQMIKVEMVSMRAYLPQEGKYPTVTLETVGSGTPTAAPTPTSTPIPSGTITGFSIPTSNANVGWIMTGPDGNLWFTEGSGNKIGRITPTGVITEYPLTTTNADPFRIVTGSDGNLWFTESSGNKIGRITPSGMITEFPLSTIKAEPFIIISGPDGNLWFTESSSNSIGRITHTGEVTEFPLPTPKARPGWIITGPDGNLWFTENSGYNIGRITPEGVITEFPLSTTRAYPSGIIAGSDGNIWFTEVGANKIGRITPGGTITEFTVPGYPSDGIVVGPDGNLWFTLFLGINIGRIGLITPTGNISVFPIIKANPMWIITGQDGNLWFTERNTNKIGRITPFGIITEIPLPTGSKSIRWIVTGPDDNLWFTELTGNVIRRITP